MPIKVSWDGHAVAVARVRGFRRTTAVVSIREGDEPGLVRKTPGATTYEPLVLERFRTLDTAFEEWANLVFTPARPQPADAFRKDVRIELFDGSGEMIVTYIVHRCWPSEYVPLSELDAEPTEPIQESLTLQHEGWERVPA
jgi:phage tail-like protein